MRANNIRREQVVRIIQNLCVIYTVLVLVSRYFWVQNLGSSVLHNKLNLYIVGFFLF